MSNISEQIRKPAIIVFLILGVYFLLSSNYRNAALAFLVAIIWTREFDELVRRILGR